VRPALSSEQFPCLGPDPLHNFLCGLTAHQRSGLSVLCLHALHAAREFRRAGASKSGQNQSRSNGERRGCGQRGDRETA
jgi:hypothetical protein